MGFGQLEWLRRKISDLLNQQRVDQKADMIETNTATQNVITNTIYTDNDVTRDEINTLLWQDNDVTRDEIINNLRPLLGGGHLPTVTGIIRHYIQDHSAPLDVTYTGKGFFYIVNSDYGSWYTITIDGGAPFQTVRKNINNWAVFGIFSTSIQLTMTMNFAQSLSSTIYIYFTT